MSKKAKGSKNDISNRGTAARLKRLNGKEVTPVAYDGSSMKHGRYMAAKYVEGGAVVRDSSGKPVPYSQIVDSSDLI